MDLESMAERLMAAEYLYMRQVFRVEKNAMTEGTLSLPQFWGMRHIELHEPCPVNELTQALSLSFSSASGLVDRLVKLGMVNREHSTEDRRVVLLSLTDEGRHAVEVVKNEKKKNLRQLFTTMSDAERDQFVNMVEKLFSGQTNT